MAQTIRRATFANAADVTMHRAMFARDAAQMTRLITTSTTTRAVFASAAAVLTMLPIMMRTMIVVEIGLAPLMIAVGDKVADEVVDVVVTTPRAMTAAAMAPTIRHNRVAGGSGKVATSRNPMSF